MSGWGGSRSQLGLSLTTSAAPKSVAGNIDVHSGTRRASIIVLCNYCSWRGSERRKAAYSICSYRKYPLRYSTLQRPCRGDFDNTLEV